MPGILDRRNEWVGVDSICARNVSYGIKERRNACLRAKMPWAAAVVAGVDLAVSGLVFLDIEVFRVGLRVTELLCWQEVSGWLVSSGVWNVTFFANFFSSNMVTTSIKVVGALLETLNVRIPSQLEAA